MMHPLIARIFGDFMQSRIEKQAARERMIEEVANSAPSAWWKQHTNDEARARRIAKTLVSPRQLKKMEKAGRREAKARVQI